MAVTVTRVSAEWSPTSTPPGTGEYPGAVQVATNGRGALIWLPAGDAFGGPGTLATVDSTANGMKRGALEVKPQKPKLMMDPSDPTTWQRPYRQASGA